MSGHDHSHTADAGQDRRRLLAALSVTVMIMAAEVVGTVLSGSLALLADAGHMLTDASGLLIALIAASLALRPRTPERTWGYQRAEVLAAALQAGLLLVVGAFVIYEAVRRLVEPPEVGSGAMLWFGIIGLVGNAVSLLVLAAGRRSSFNLRAAFLEVLNDALGSVASSTPPSSSKPPPIAIRNASTTDRTRITGATRSRSGCAGLWVIYEVQRPCGPWSSQGSGVNASGVQLDGPGTEVSGRLCRSGRCQGMTFAPRRGRPLWGPGAGLRGSERRTSHRRWRWPRSAPRRWLAHCLVAGASPREASVKRT